MWHGISVHKVDRVLRKIMNGLNNKDTSMQEEIGGKETHSGESNTIDGISHQAQKAADRLERPIIIIGENAAREWDDHVATQG